MTEPTERGSENPPPERSLRGTLVSVSLVLATIILCWAGMFMLVQSRH